MSKDKKQTDAKEERQLGNPVTRMPFVAPYRSPFGNYPSDLTLGPLAAVALLTGCHPDNAVIALAVAMAESLNDNSACGAVVRQTAAAAATTGLGCSGLKAWASYNNGAYIDFLGSANAAISAALEASRRTHIPQSR